MNIVFLDIDGVLASWLKMGNINVDADGHLFEPAAIEALNKITNHIDGKIVISSTWRETRTLEIFQDFFKRRGVEGEVIGLTPELDNGRADEIQTWIDENEVDYFIIIDDDTRGIEEHFKENMNVLRTNLYRCLDHYDYLYAENSYRLYTKKTRR
jgi:hypothetical protein